MAGATSRGFFGGSLDCARDFACGLKRPQNGSTSAHASVATLPRPSLRIGQGWVCSRPPTCRPERSAREPKDPGNVSRATTASGNSLECFFPVRIRSSLKFPASAWRGRHRGDPSAAPSTALGISPAGSNARRTAQLPLTPQSLRFLGLRSGWAVVGCALARRPAVLSEARAESKREPKDPGNISRATTASGNSLECFFPVRVRSSLKFPVSAWRGRHRGDPSTWPQSLRSLGLRSGLGREGCALARRPAVLSEARASRRTPGIFPCDDSFREFS